MSVIADQTQLLTVAEVAALCHCHRNTIYRAVWSGDLKAVKIGRVLRFEPDDVQRWFDERSTR